MAKARRARKGAKQTIGKPKRSAPQLSASIEQLLRPLSDLERFKRRLIGLITLIALPLLGYYVVHRDIFSQYALTLFFVSAVLVIWALPRLRLGLTAAYLFVMPLFLYLGNTEYGYSKAIFSLWVISLLAVMWVIETLLKPDARFNLTHLLWPGLVLIGVTLLSLVHAQVFWGDFQYVGLLFYFFLCALLVANTIQSRRDFHFLLGALLFSGALASLYGLLQYYGRLPGTPGFSNGSEAILSTFGNKNYFAGFLAYLFAPGLLLLFSERSWATRLLVLLELGMLYLGVLAASSYSAWLGIILALTFILITLWFYRGGAVLQEHRRWAGVLLGVLFLALLFYLVTTIAWIDHQIVSWTTIRLALIKVAPAWGTFIILPLFFIFGLARSWLEKLRSRWGWAVALAVLLIALGFGLVHSRWGQQSLIDPVFSKLSYAASVGARVEDWQIASRMFRDHPILGIGLGEYKRQFLPYKARYLQTPQGQALNARVGYIPRAAQAHNDYVQIAAEMGLLGLLASASLILMIFWSALRRVTSSEPAELTFALLALLGGVIAFLSDASFSFPLHLPANALVFAFLLGVLYSPALGAKPLEFRLRPAGKRALVASLATLALIVSILAYRDFVSDVNLNSGKGEVALGDYQQALRDFQTSVALDVQPGENLIWLAQLEIAQGDTAQAERLYLRSLKSFNTEEGYYSLASLYVKNQDYQRASYYLDQLLAMDPETSLKLEAQYLRALTAFNQQDWQTALPLLELLIKQHPDDERAYIPMGQYQATQKQYADARVTLTKARELIERKLADVSKIINPNDTISLPAQQYYQAKADQARLQKEKETVDQLLQALPSAG
jgi:tetratricopeptide (TPR) repeat protein